MTKVRETTLTVQGMNCPSCVNHIDKALSEVNGVEKVTVKLREGKVVIIHDPALAPIPVLVETIQEAGYESRLSA